MSLKNFMSYEDAATVLGKYADKVNELKSGLTNYENQNDLNLEVPNRKNLFNPNSTLQLGFSNSAGTNGTFTSGSYYAYVVKKRSVSSFTISGADFTKIDDASIRVFTSSDYPAIGVSEWRGSNISASTSKTVTLSENDQYLTFLIKWEDTATQADKETIMVEEGSTATTFAPYIPSVDARLEAVESGLENFKTLFVSVTTGDYRDKFNSMYSTISALNFHDRVKSFINFTGTICNYCDMTGNSYVYIGSYYQSGKLIKMIVTVDSQYSGIMKMEIDETAVTKTDLHTTEDSNKFTLYV